MIWKWGPGFLEFCQQSCSGILAELQAGDRIVIEPWIHQIAFIILRRDKGMFDLGYVLDMRGTQLCLWLGDYKGDQSQRSDANYVLLIRATLLKSWTLTVHHLYQRDCNLRAKGTKGEVHWVFWEWDFYFLNPGPLKWLLNVTCLTVWCQVSDGIGKTYQRPLQLYFFGFEESSIVSFMEIFLCLDCWHLLNVLPWHVKSNFWRCSGASVSSTDLLSKANQLLYVLSHALNVRGALYQS